MKQAVIDQILRQLEEREALYNILKCRAGVALFTIHDAIKPFAAARAQRLVDRGWGILGSRGTVETLDKAGVESFDIAKITGTGPSSGHLVVTISGEIAKAILLRSEEGLWELEELCIPSIDLVWAALYPLYEAIAAEGATHESVWKSTDIGGRVLLMEAAKAGIPAAYTVNQMDRYLDWMDQGCPSDVEVRNDSSWMADAEVAKYSLASAGFHSGGICHGEITIDEAA